MTALRIALAFVLFVMATPDARAAGAPASVAHPVEVVRLANGLQVILAPDPSARLVSVVTSYRVGTGDDPNGRRGLAHVTEHLVAERTKHVESGLAELEALGALRFNAETSLDHTDYFETLPPERLAAALWLESDRMGFAADALSSERLASASAAVRNEELQKVVDVAAGSFSSTTMPELFPEWHPYSTADGFSDVADVTLANVRAFLATWYLPANATLAIAGRFDRSSTLAAIETYFGPLAATLPPVRPELPASRAHDVRLVIGVPVSREQVVIEWRGPPYGSRDDAALDLVSEALTGAGNEQVDTALVATGLATHVTSRERSFAGDSFFMLHAAVAPGVSAPAVLAALERSMVGLGHALTGEEISRAREIERRSAIARLETTWGRASFLTELARAGINPTGALDRGDPRYTAVTDDEVRRAATTWLVEAPRVRTVIAHDVNAAARGHLVRRDDVEP